MNTIDMGEPLYEYTLKITGVTETNQSRQ